MSAISPLQSGTSLEGPQSTPDSIAGSPDFSPIHTSSSKSSLSSIGISSGFSKEERSKPVNRTRVDLKTEAAGDLNRAKGVPEASSGAYGKLQDTYGNNFELPTFTIKDIRSAIPVHCYERNAVRFMSYVLSDLMKIATIWGIAYRFLNPEYVPSTVLRGLLWVVYGIVNGCVATGLWVLAHEAGHQSCSPSKIVNDTVGFICHSLLLVPYFSWKISHGKHHKATGNIERDMVFVPPTREQYASRVKLLAHELSELIKETPISTAISLVLQQLFGWPFYLMINVTGHDCHERQPEGRGVGKKNGWFGGVNHFVPSSPLYEAKDGKLIAASDVGLGLVGLGLYWIGKSYGWANLFLWYGQVYLHVNFWLVAITYLQHTDPSLPHYEDSSVWNFARGAAATIDRELGFVGRNVMHGIIETHVLHHFVSNIPFYNADEASEAIKPILGSHYRSSAADGTLGFFKALWNNSRSCQWLESAPEAEGAGKKVLFFRNRNGLGLPPAKLPPS